MNYLERINLQELKEKRLADFSPTELAALLIQKYPSAPYAHLVAIWSNKDISKMLYSHTKIILEGAGYDTTENDVKTVSIKNRFRGRSYEIRSTNN